MVHPLVWPSRPTFHPLGGSPAFSLTQDLTPEQSADILMLGCGDVYNVLFTLSTDTAVPSNPRKLDITCCDIEPAVLARNVLAFALLHDDASLDRIWDIYYHFKIDEQSTNLLVTQCHRLIEAAESMDTWRQSPYYSFLKFSDSNTLSESRRHWTLYAEFAGIGAVRLNKLKKEQEDLSRKLKTRLQTSMYTGAGRSATFLYHRVVKQVSDQYGTFWENGTTSMAPDDIKNAQQLNPTWVYSLQGEKFTAHENSYPMAYHFVSAVAPISFDPVGPSTGSVMDKAKQQFKAACSAFQSSRKADAIILRFILGDALHLCYAIQNKSTNIITRPWCTTLFDLTEDSTSSPPPPPQTFDVIDTSDLMNSLGAINILLATQPLLKTSPASQSVVYTESSTTSGQAAVEIFIERICSDPSTFGTVVGLLPRAYLSSFDSTSNTHELVIRDSHEHNQRMAWVHPTSGDNYARTERAVPQFASGDVAKVLGDMYPHMFFFDNVPEFFAPATMPQLRTFSEPHHTRETVAMLFRHAQSRVGLVGGTWHKEIELFLDIVKKDQTIYQGSNHLEDLLLQLSIAGVCTLGAGVGPGVGIFQGWPDVPSVVCVVLVVPGVKLDIIRGDDEVVQPKLVCSIRKTPKGLTNIHSSIHPVWGKCIPTSDGRFTVEQDPAGIHGNSDLVVSFWASSKLLEGDDIHVSLALRYTPLTLKLHRKKLGPNYELFSAELKDEKHVHILRERPMGNSKAQSVPQLNTTPTSDVQSPLTFQVEGGCKRGLGNMSRWYLKTITSRLDIQSPAEQESLLAGAVFHVIQLAPCTIRVSFAEHAHIVTFPYPIRETQKKLRIARKSHYVEIIAPPFNPLENGYPLDIFPVLQTPHPSPWNIHHIRLDSMPLLSIKNPKEFYWLIIHTALQWSDREYLEQRSRGGSGGGSINKMKTTFSTFMGDYAGIRSLPVTTFSLYQPGKDMEWLILVNGMRVDLAGGTVILDVGVIPVSDSNRASLLSTLNSLGAEGVIHMMRLQVEPRELLLWKQLFPVFIERCRTWSHTPNCERASRGTEPLFVQDDIDPICSCGLGLGFGGSEWSERGKDLLPHATRAAISPIFAVPYLELVAGPAFNRKREEPPQSEPANTCWECGNIGGTLMACARCKAARYCSVECQKKNWKKHKPNCKEV
ncbi:hypothetical protein BDV93DRAFT_608175 [Ceratobasidium sp. AG-I]|nr:hypothetical protein BDV93DRAFT_608175 [Ceratobasidium sp. AG-I]